MKKAKVIMLCFSLTLALQSCNKKKLTEVVEVPLPAAEEKQTIGHPDDVQADPGAFEMIKLPYAYDALSPHIDALTMETHYSKHYLTYTNNFNRALDGTERQNLPLNEILTKLDMSDANLRNNAGGYYNHSLFFEIMSPKGGGQPKDTLAAVIVRDFGSYENFKTEFEGTANRHFGSGWTWLVVDRSGKLKVASTQNQDNPLMPQSPVPGTPILGLDLWEHAYYLGYKYKRSNYIQAFFNVINWEKVSEKYEDAVRKKY
ncbi:MAG TPA: superoxide dismutase [Flavobacterium sp.]